LNEKKQRIILTVASKHFGHVTFYAADEESGSEKFYAREKNLPFVLNPPQMGCLLPNV